MSASSSFFRFILSFRASASRRAIWIFCWMDSWFMSAMLHSLYQTVRRWSRGRREAASGQIQGSRRERSSPDTETRTGAGTAVDSRQQWRERRAEQTQLLAQSRRRRTAVVELGDGSVAVEVLEMSEVQERPGVSLG